MYKSIFKHIIPLIFSLLLLTSCGIDSHSEKQKYYDDYEYLWDLLQSDFPYYSTFEQLGIDVNSVREQYNNSLSTISTDEQYYQLLESMFHDMSNLGHLSVISPDEYASYYNLFNQKSTFHDDYEAFRRVLSSSTLSEIYKLSSQNDYADNNIFIDNDSLQTLTKYYDNLQTIYIKIPSFRDELIERDKNVINEALKSYPEAENLIIDISSNNGGSDYYWLNNIVGPLGDGKTFSWNIYYKDTDTVKEFYQDLGGKDIENYSEFPQWVSDMGLTRVCSASMKPDFSLDNTEIDHNINKYVLVGPSVYSASDSFAAYCKATQWATLVGTKTGGDGLGTTPVITALPNSGLLIRFSCTVGENPDGTQNIFGTIPDIICSNGESSLQKALKLIENTYKN